MKYFLILSIFIVGLKFASAQQPQPQTELQTNSQLAIVYYNAKDYDKAIPLLLGVYQASRNSYYFQLYLASLIELKRFEEAENQLKKEIKKQNAPSPELLINLGYILKVQKRNDEASAKYDEAIQTLPEGKSYYLVAANTFLQWAEYEWAEKTYLKGRAVMPQEQFNFELARIYLYLRNYDQMLEEYLDLLRQDEKQLPRIESSLSATMQLDIDNGLRDKYRELVLKRIQAEPNVIGYNRMLIWFFLQEKKFSSALRQAIALDRRTGAEDGQIIQLGQMALNNKNYTDAQKAFEYIIGKGESNPLFVHAFAQGIHSSYMRFITEFPNDIEEGRKISVQFDEGLKYLGYNSTSLNLILEYAHLLAFFMNEPDSAITVLQKGLEMPRMTVEMIGILKTEMADIYVYSDDPWEATLIYSQVIDANKNNSLGDDVKLKKAKLGYYLGNFSWAKAQLDVLKASTSKLTANDAMELSLLIGNNLNLDTTAIPLEMFSRADLLFFRNKDSQAMQTLDSIAEIYPYHTLVDDILYRKSKIEIDRQNYSKAAEYLQQIVDGFSYDALADDALFLLAEVYHYNLDDLEKAKEYYKEMMTRYPGSVFVDESRKKYRELRELFPDKDSELNKEDQLFQEIKSNEFE